MISLDDYFVDRDHTPVDENGELDYESLYSLDLDLFNSHLSTLIAGGEVELPYYNFSTGLREYRGKTLRLDPDNVLIIEGIHGLNPELTASIPARMKFKVYVSALTTINIDDHNWIPTTDNRLLRRIIRDYKYRGTSAVDTIRRCGGQVLRCADFESFPNRASRRGGAEGGDICRVLMTMELSNGDGPVVQQCGHVKDFLNS